MITSHPHTVPLVSSTLLPSTLRTAVPILYALLVKAGVVAWLGIDDALVNNVITGVVTVAFYIALRVLERYQSKIGWLLGYASQPVYVASGGQGAVNVIAGATVKPVSDDDQIV